MNSIQSSSMVSMMAMPPVNNISKDIISKNDSNSDSALSIDELGMSQDLFSSLDSDGDMLVTSNEIASAIDSQLSQFNGQMPSKKEFESLLSDLGLEMQKLPEKSMDSNPMVADIMSFYDVDGDSTLSSEEVSVLNESEFGALDMNSDGSITADEINSAFEQVAQEKPAGGQSGGGGEGSDTSSEEEYDDADTNQDGIVSFEEKMAAMGVDTSSTETNSQDNSNQEILNTIKTLFEAIKKNSVQKDEDIELSNFKNLMTMINNKNNNTELNTYVSNLTSSSSKFNYA